MWDAIKLWGVYVFLMSELNCLHMQWFLCKWKPPQTMNVKRETKCSSERWRPQGTRIHADDRVTKTSRTCNWKVFQMWCTKCKWIPVKYEKKKKMKKRKKNNIWLKLYNLIKLFFSHCGSVKSSRLCLSAYQWHQLNSADEGMFFYRLEAFVSFTDLVSLKKPQLISPSSNRMGIAFNVIPSKTTF